MRKMIVMILSIVIVAAIALFLVNYSRPRIQLIKKESFFDTFEVDNNETRIICILSIKNNTNEVITISVKAMFDQDYQNQYQPLQIGICFSLLKEDLPTVRTRI